MIADPRPDRNSHDDESFGRLLDSLAEMPEPGDEVYTSADDWPDSYDSIRVMLGPAVFPHERFDDLPDDDADDAF